MGRDMSNLVGVAVKVTKHATTAYADHVSILLGDVDRAERIAAEEAAMLRGLTDKELTTVVLVLASFAAGALLELADLTDQPAHDVVGSVLGQLVNGNPANGEAGGGS